VYGLGANVFDAEAVQRIFEAKARPADNPLIAHVADLSLIDQLAATIPESARRLMARFFPGPLTLVLPKTDRVPDVATAGLDTIGVRMPAHQLAIRFLLACETPVVAPSANLSGRPSPTNWQAVHEDLEGRIDCLLQGDATEIGIESTVVDCTSEIPLVLRAGGVTLEDLRSVVPATQVYLKQDDERPRSPGMVHRHYCPRAAVVLVSDLRFNPEPRSAWIGLERPASDRFDSINQCDSVEQYAQRLFAFFRECDREGIARIYCQTVDERGMGVALMDRLQRAASGK
jgi:L-threonylcarbamoyladenylate synthase